MCSPSSLPSLSGSLLRARWALFTVGAVALVASFIVNLRWTAAGNVDGLLNSTRFTFFSPYSRAFEFAAGVLVALLPTLHAARRLRSASGWLGAGGLAFSFGVINGDWTIPGWTVWAPVITSILLLVANDHGVVGALLRSRPLVWIGDRSYGLYLWHWPLLVFGERIGDGLWPIAITMSFALAALSYRFVEEPFRANRSIVGRRAVVLAVVCVATPWMLATGLLRAMDGGLGIAGVEELRGRAEARTAGCHTDLDEPIRSLEDCTWSADASRGTIMLVGDSHAVSISDAVIEAGTADDYDVIVRTRSLCPFHSRRIKRQGCAEYQRDTVEEIRQVEPDVVVIANRAPSYINPTVGDGPFPIVDDQDRVTTTFAEGVAAWDEGLRETISEIRTSADRIVIVDTVPEFEAGTASESISLISRSGSRQELTLADVAARSRSDKRDPPGDRSRLFRGQCARPCPAVVRSDVHAARRRAVELLRRRSPLTPRSRASCEPAANLVEHRLRPSGQSACFVVGAAIARPSMNERSDEGVARGPAHGVAGERTVQ